MERLVLLSAAFSCSIYVQGLGFDENPQLIPCILSPICSTVSLGTPDKIKMVDELELQFPSVSSVGFRLYLILELLPKELMVLINIIGRRF